MPHLIVYDQRITALTLRWLRVFDYFSDQHTPSTMSSSPQSPAPRQVQLGPDCDGICMRHSLHYDGWEGSVNLVPYEDYLTAPLPVILR